MSLTIANQPLIWYNGVKSLSNKNLKTNHTPAKPKNYGRFNSILSVIGERQNEILCLGLLSTFCLLVCTWNAFCDHVF